MSTNGLTVAAATFFKRSPMWVPVSTRTPAFTGAFRNFLNGNPHTTRLFTGLQYDPELTMVVEKTKDASVSPPTTYPYLMAFPLKVTEAIVDPSSGIVCNGMLASLVDSSTSIHVMEMLLPNDNTHVSVNIQCVFLPHQLKLGEEFVVVSRMDKVGARLVYGSSEFLLLSDEKLKSAESSGSPAASMQALEHELKYNYTVCVQGSHVKSISSKQRGK